LKSKLRLSSYLKKSSVGITIGLSVLKVLKALPTLIILILSAKYFGASSERDAWIVAVSIITVIIQILFGPLNETFITKYIHIREEESVEKVNRATDSLVSGIIFLCIIVSSGIFLFSRTLVDLFAPGFSEPEKLVLIKMLRILIPSLLFLQITNIWSSILNAYKSYFIPDLLASISLIINIILIIALSSFIGIYSLIVSAYINYLLLTIVLYRELRYKFKYRFRLTIPRFELLKPFLLFALPLFINYLFSQTDTIIERSLTTRMGTGSVSILDYARKFFDLPLGLMMSVITTVLTPILSLYYVKNTAGELFGETQKYFRFIVIIMLPIVVMLIVLPEELVRVLLVRGKFSIGLVASTSSILRWYGVGLFAVIFYIIYSQLIISQKRVYFFSKVVIASYLIKIPCNLLFYKTLGLITFPMTLILTNFIMGIIFMYFGSKDYRKMLVTDAAQMIFLFALLNATCYFGREFIRTFIHSDLVVCVLVFILILVIEVMLIFILRFQEGPTIKNLTNKLKLSLRAK